MKFGVIPEVVTLPIMLEVKAVPGPTGVLLNASPLWKSETPVHDIVEPCVRSPSQDTLISSPTCKALERV